jgi:uncharacterized protein with HEPN domain
LRDIGDNIAAVEQLLTGLDLSTFLTDRKTVYAVIRALAIISEASRSLPDEMQERYPEIDWQAIRSAGNVFRHEYESLDEALIWHTARHELTSLKTSHCD